MHELAIAQNILDIAEDELARHNCTKLTLLRVEIGAISGVMVDALEFGLQCLVKGTPHESAVFDIVRVPLRLRCGSCGKEFEGDARRRRSFPVSGLRRSARPFCPERQGTARHLD